MNIDKTLDRIYDMIDKWCKEENWRQIDAYIAAITYSIFSMQMFGDFFELSSSQIDIYMGVLTATLPCKHNLQMRNKLYEMLSDYVGKAVLVGLE